MVPYLPRASDALGFLRSTGNGSSAPGLMQTYLNDGPSLRLFLDALPSLPPQQAAQCCMFGGVEVVLLALHAHGYEPRVQTSGLRAFTALVVACSPFATHPAASANGMNAAFFAMRTYGADAEVVEAALDVLAAVVQGSGPVSAMAAANAGGINDALAALRTHAASPGVCRAACTSIAYVVVESPTAQASASGVNGAVLDALRTHASPATREAALWALNNLVDNCGANCSLAKFVKGPDTVSRLLPTLAPEAAAQGARFIALLGDGGGGEVVAAMLAHPAHVGVQHYGVKALFHIAGIEKERAAAKAAGARFAIEQACALHWGTFSATTRAQAKLLEAKFAEITEEKEQEKKDEPAVIEARTAVSVAVPLALPSSAVAAAQHDDAAVQFGTFDAKQHNATPDAAAAPPPDSEEASPAMQEHLDALMPWLRLDSGLPTPATPPPPAPEPAPAEPPSKPPAPAVAPAAALATPAPAAAVAAVPAAPAPVPTAPEPVPAAKKAPAARSAADEERETFVICLHERVCVALLPCRHFPMCAEPECAAMLGKPPLCPMCRLEVAERVVVAPPPPMAQPPAPQGNAWKRGPPALSVPKEPPPLPACVGGCGARPCVLFMPCRHLVLCGDAACAAKAGGGSDDAAAGGKKRLRCPACRAEAAAVTTLFLL